MWGGGRLWEEARAVKPTSLVRIREIDADRHYKI
jgi:hypothetical protein